MKEVLITLIFVLVQISCGSNDTADDSDVNEEKLYGSYRASFNAAKGEVDLFTQFRLGGDTGTTIRLTDPASITANGSSMELRDGNTNTVNFIGTYYKITEILETPSESYTFIWTRRDKSTYTNTLSMAKAVSVESPSSNSSHSRSSELTVSYEGDDLGTGEELVCTIDSKETRPDDIEEDVGFDLKTISSGKECLFTTSEMKNFRLGQAEIYVERVKKQGDPTQGHDAVGGDLRSYYRSKIVTVTITE
jgi:hypothetical protein